MPLSHLNQGTGKVVKIARVERSVFKKGCEELIAIPWIPLRSNSSCRIGQKELFLELKHGNPTSL
jgi:hypothetical protein